MRSPTGPTWYGPWPDDHVDRPEVYAPQGVQPTGTNRPRAWNNLARARYGMLGGMPRLTTRFPVATAVGKHPFPFRTRQLSPPAPMVLGGRPPGRVGRRRDTPRRSPPSGGSFARVATFRAMARPPRRPARRDGGD